MYTQTIQPFVYQGMDQWLLAVTSDQVAKGSAKDLEVAGAGPDYCHLALPLFFPYHVQFRTLSFSVYFIELL